MRKPFLYWLIEGRLYQISSKIPFLNWERTHYNKKSILSITSGAEELVNAVGKGKPYLAGRFGTSECNAAVQYIRKQKRIVKGYGYHLEEMVNNAGFFPMDSKFLDKYCETVLDLYKQIDLLCVMNCVAEGYIVQEYCQNAQLTRLPVVDPIRTKWTKCLAGKKVLVIHPMADTIRTQYQKRKDIFVSDNNILPEFDLRIIKAVQTIAGEKDPRFDNWFEALKYMEEKALDEDFDIALIGCGAYGLPLGALLKKAGKIAVHMGGCLQLLFGIKGARWEQRSEYVKYMNEAWVKPSEDEIPFGFKKVEGGCYW